MIEIHPLRDKEKLAKLYVENKHQATVLAIKEGLV